MVSVLLTNFGAPSSATVKRTTKGSDFENLSLLGRPRAPRIKVIAIPISSQQCLGQFVWNPSKGQCFFTQSKSLNFAQYKKLPTAALYQWFMLPLPIWPKYNWRFQILSHHLPPRGIFQSIKLLVLDIFLLLRIFTLDHTNQSFISRREQTNFCRSLICNFTPAPGGEFPWKGKISPMLIFKRLASIFR